MTDKSEIETSTDLELLSTTKALTNATAYTEANNNTSFLEDDLVTTTTLNVDNDIDNATIDTINVAKMSHNLVKCTEVNLENNQLSAYSAVSKTFNLYKQEK